MTKPTPLRTVYIVGNSRSGTTMLGRVLGNHPKIFTYHELHFFEGIWDPVNEPGEISEERAIEIGTELMSRQKEGVLSTNRDPGRYRNAARAVFADLAKPFTAYRVFTHILTHITKGKGKLLSCEQTPRNVFFIGQILKLDKCARVIHMIRDPRDTLLSQRGKWKRRWRGASEIPRREAFRSFINYNPILISILWRSAIGAGLQYRDDERVWSLRYEDLIADPQKQIEAVCAFLGIEYLPQMLEVQRIGSSNTSDAQGNTGIDASRTGIGLKRLSVGEIAICETIGRPLMGSLHYPITNPRGAVIGVLLWTLLLPIQIALIALLNVRRHKNILRSIKRRLSWTVVLPRSRNKN